MGETDVTERQPKATPEPALTRDQRRYKERVETEAQSILGEE